MSKFLNRDSYVVDLNNLIYKEQAQLIALYGRRRVGKTLLVRHCFQHSDLHYMEVTGLKDGNMKQQLLIFTKAFARCFYNNASLAPFDDWFKAFEALSEQLEKLADNRPFVLFLDELPWLTTKRSGLLQAIDHYWNTRWSLLPFVNVVLCGSAASWMLDNIINAKGGLHNRVSKIINLKPFNLRETKQFLQAKKFKLNNKNILEIYMIMGGIPYYLEQLERSKSITESINALCFHPEGILLNEFPRLFRSLFNLSEVNLKIIKAIAAQRYGISRQQLIQKTHLTSGGNFNARLNELEAASFIKRYAPYGYNKKEIHFRVIDEYTLFYLRWIEPHLASGFEFSANHWQTQSNTASWHSWAGYAFEGVCLKHVSAIQRALKLDRVACTSHNWRYIDKKKTVKQGAQIDFLFDRNDNAITLCEAKHTQHKFIIDKAYAKSLLSKMDIFAKQTNTTKQLFLAMITIYGIKKTVWSDEIVDASVTLDDLFADS